MYTTPVLTTSLRLAHGQFDHTRHSWLFTIQQVYIYRMYPNVQQFTRNTSTTNALESQPSLKTHSLNPPNPQRNPRPNLPSNLRARQYRRMFLNLRIHTTRERKNVVPNQNRQRRLPQQHQLQQFKKTKKETNLKIRQREPLAQTRPRPIRKRQYMPMSNDLLRSPHDTAHIIQPPLRDELFCIGAPQRF